MNRAQRRSAARHDRRRPHCRDLPAAVLSGAGEAGAAATTFTVTQSTDDGTATVGSLSWAITQADANPGQDTIDFSVTGTITVTGDLPHIDDAVHITGPGASVLTIDGGWRHGDGTSTGHTLFVFDRVYSADGTNEISGLTITGGMAEDNTDNSGGAIQVYYGSADLLIADSVITANAAPSNDGGGIQLYHNTGTVTISGTTISDNEALYGGGGGLYAHGGTTGGRSLTIVIRDSQITGNYAYHDGGGLYVRLATLEVDHSTISNNVAHYDASGGGVAIKHDATVTINSSTISGNRAYYGAGIAADGGGDTGTSLTVFDTVISDNTASVQGGGLYVAHTTTSIDDTTISGNTAGSGGGGLFSKFNEYEISILDSTISGNSSNGYGGGLYLGTSVSSTTTIANSTISGNTANQAGGIYGGHAGGIQIAQATITDNTALYSDEEASYGVPAGGIQMGAPGVILEHRAHAHPQAVHEHRAHPAQTGDRHAGREAHQAKVQARREGRLSVAAAPGAGELHLSGVIVAGNHTPNAADGRDIGSYEHAEVTVSSDHSILGAVDTPSVTVVDAGGTQRDVPGSALLLGPLADNGGATHTHALLDGSPAIDAGPDPVADFPDNQWDQRADGYARVVNGRVDVGAFEVQPPPVPEPTFTG